MNVSFFKGVCEIFLTRQQYAKPNAKPEDIY